MRWRLILEEYGPELVYVKGEHNVVADALSRLDLTVDDNPSNPTLNYMSEIFGLSKDDIPSTIYPLKYSFLEQEQRKDKDLMTNRANDSTTFRFKAFCGGGKHYDLIVTENDKIVVPKQLQKRVVTWYHETPCHPGETRTEQTIRLNFNWKNLRKDVEDICKKCHTCQVHKRKKKKYGHLPEKEAEAEPWERLCVDCIGPYTIKRKNKKSLTLWCVTMIDPATGWFEMRELPNKYASTLANIVEQTWLTRYPWPQIINYDRGTEFMAEFAEMVENDYGIKRKPITKRNPQANAIIERVHQTIANIIQVHQLYDDDDVDENDPFTGILTATMFAMRATYHTTMQATPNTISVW
jgi:transposase InsO family protein